MIGPLTRKLLPKSWVEKLEAADPDPTDLTVNTAYKTRWIWYHTIMAIELLVIIFLLTGILVVLAIKL